MALEHKWKKLHSDCIGYTIKLTRGEGSHRKILVLIDFPESEDTHILDEERLATYLNVVGHALRHESERPDNLEILLACPRRPDKRSSSQLEIIKLLNELNPDALIVGGFTAAKVLWGEGIYASHYGYFRDCKFSAQDIKGKTLTHRVWSAYSIPLYGWTHPRPAVKGDNGGGFVNLIGEFIEHLQTAIRGWNRYTIHVPGDLQIKRVDTIKRFDQFYERLIETPTPSIDTETKNLNRIANRMLTAQFLLPTEREDEWYDLYFLPLAHREAPWLPEELQYIHRKLRKYYETGRSKYHIYHGAKFDLGQWMGQLGVRWYNHRVYDTQGGAFLLNENLKFLKQTGVKAYALASMETRYGYVRPDSILDKEDRGNMENKTLDEIEPYGMLDVISPYLIHKCQIAEAKRRGYKNYVELVTDQISNMTAVMTHMEHNGMGIDRAYVQSLTHPNSDLNNKIEIALNKFHNSEAAIAVNDRLLEERGYVGGGLFKTNEKPWLFDLGKERHKNELFIQELGLEPIDYGKKGEPLFNKKFQDTYKHVPEMIDFKAVSKLTKIKTGFVDNIAETLITNEDALADGRIRSSYHWLYISTLRSSSTDPNLQNQPSRGELAKIVKREWTAPPGKVLLKADLRAHEVRGLGNIAFDKTIKKLFITADQALTELRVASLKELEQALDAYKKNGDIHIINVKVFYGIVVDKDHILRYQIKRIVFGTIYGQAAFSLAAAMTDDGYPTSEEDAQTIIDKLFENWREGGQWIKRIHREGQDNLVVFSQIGVPRHLPAYLHNSPKVRSAMNRRGPNSIIQGFSSISAYTGGYLIARERWNTFTRRGIDLGMKQVNAVHDSVVSEINFATLPIGIYLLEHGMTSLTRDHYREIYNVDLPIPFNIDIETGLNEAEMMEWKDQRFDTMRKHIAIHHASSLKRQSEGFNAETVAEGLIQAAEMHDVRKRDLDYALHNLEKLAAVRVKELRNDRFEMTLRNRTDWFLKNMKGLTGSGV